MTTQWQAPPPPQDEDTRVFKVGDCVRAVMTFSLSCPPSEPVKWSSGEWCEVVDRLLDLEVGP